MSGKLLLRTGRNRDNVVLPPDPGILAYLEDADVSGSPGGLFSASNLAPRVIFINSNIGLPNSQQLSKFDIVATLGAELQRIASAQAIDTTVLAFYQFNPRSYLQGERVDCLQPHSHPFNFSGPISDGNCTIFPGHWLYQPGSTINTQGGGGLTVSSTSVTVTNGALFAVNNYAVIRDGLSNWANAEHVLVTAKSGNVLTITRGFKSSPVAHAAGSVMAQHVLGLGTSGVGTPGTLWAWNMSTQCPLDGAGRRTWQVLADWAAANYNRNSNGNVVSGLRIDGIRYDTDRHFYFGTALSDHNNDLVSDSGMSSTGVNWWGDGLNLFYERMRTLLPNMILVGGESNARGFDYLNGVEIEGFPIVENGGEGTPPYGPGAYPKIDQFLNVIAFRKAHKGPGVQCSFAWSRMFSNRYQFGEVPVNPDNACFRFGLGLSLLEDCWWGQDNSEAWVEEVAELWWDEFAVITAAGPTFGNAVPVNSSNEAAVRAAKGWMGRATTFRQRIYDSAAFAPAQTLLGDGSFELTIGGWTGIATTVVRDTTTGIVGSCSLRSNGHTTYQAQTQNCKIRSPIVPFTAGVDRTLCFSAKASAIREIGVTVGFSNPLQVLMIDTEWKRYVVSSRTIGTGNEFVDFHIGRENTSVWIDEVYLFNGNAAIWRRDYERGIVIVNATAVPQTVNLGGTFKRIQGTGQDAINNGALLTQVTIGHHDAAILVRPL